MQSQSNYIKPFMNSVILAVGSTILGLIVGIPSAWAMAFSPTKRTKDVLMWMLSTKMMPAAAVLVPIYLMFIWLGLLDTHLGITIVLMLINLPIIIWMLYTYFREIPGEILEAARMDGASLWGEIWNVLTPMAIPGIASTLLLNIILAWNESFWTILLTTTNAAPLTAFIASFSIAAGPLLGQALGGLGDGDRPDPDHGLVQPEAARPRPDLRRREVVTGGNEPWAPSSSATSTRPSARPSSSRSSTSTSRTASSWSSSAPRAAASPRCSG